MENLELIIDLHRDAPRQGPGGDSETRRAMTLAGLDGRRDLAIADIGCGTGAATRLLARELNATVTAVDLLPEFIAELEAAAKRENLQGRINTHVAAMDDLPFSEQSLDVIWSEGAIYNMGFREGLRYWRRFLVPGGVIAVSELTWLNVLRPDSLTRHWTEIYPQVDTAGAKITCLEENGFSPIGYFPLPRHCWTDNYYAPLQQRFSGFLERNGHSEAARAIVADEEAEIALYEEHGAFFGYGFYLARRTAD